MTYFNILVIICLSRFAISMDFQDPYFLGKSNKIKAALNQFPYQVYLAINGHHHCGGALVAQNIALTAAHCTHIISVSSLTIVAGTINRKTGGTSIQVDRIEEHPLYNNKTWVNDLAIVFLKDSFNTNLESINIILLQNFNVAVPENSLAIVSGWGIENQIDIEKPEILNFAKIPIWKVSSCKIYVLPYEEEICAGSTDGLTNSCGGDSGGPLVFNNRLIGLVSWGFGCGARNLPGVYTNISLYRNWISDVAKI